ncbi:hypothetical protein SUGI_1463080 [Cryptomeria japonica]|uniref:Uncharacterized protein n=1 Tax=Cryptomeria japonica TaxID=3369 RepID=A0AAD3RR91_CRYJA|nr:hypothetical protein SUGI_1463040 [Cryptomeria japonica]GLJ58600.1 hypothetical protein SUGI_1463080 [Cryptomeria japonica]
MAPDAQHITLLRVVVREDFNRTLAERLAADVDRVSKELEEFPPKIIHAVQGLAISEEDKKGEEEEATAVGRFGIVKLAKVSSLKPSNTSRL